MDNLLAFKAGDSYIREKDGETILCGMDKASVFPESALPEMLNKYRLLKTNYPGIAIVRLVITEEPFYEE